MRKKWVRITIAIGAFIVIFITLACVFFKRDFDKTVNVAAKNLNCYYINAKLDGDEKTITASQTVEIKNNYQKEEFIYFNLFPRAFREGATIKPYTDLNQGKCFINGESFGNLEIMNGKVNGKTFQIEYVGEDENALKVPVNFKDKDRVKVELEYKLTIPNCNHRFGFLDGNINLGNWFPILAHYSNGEFNIEPYYSTGDPFVSDVANYTVKFEYPVNMEMATTGNVLSSSISQNKNAFIEAKAVRDFALIFSDKFKVATINTKNTTVKYFGYVGDEDLNKMASLIKDGLEYFNSTFGEYPYRQISVVKTPFMFGGMEYPNLVLIADNIDDALDKERVLIHELAHQWWYGLVGNNQISEAWVDEALTEYSAFMFFEKYPQYGLNYHALIEDAKNTYDLYVDVITSLGGKVNYGMTNHVNVYSSEYEYSYMIYVKGTILYDDIRKTIGDKKLYKSLQKYYKAYKFKLVSGNDLIGCFEKVSGKGVREIFNKYLNGN